MTDLLKGLNIFLVGIMGVGKTTVGKLIAKEFGYRFFDTDALVEKVAGKTIKEMFATEGEASFRQLESQVLAEVSACTRSSIATGGGIVLQQMNWSYLQQGLVVWLDAPVEVIVERLQKDTTRPLLQADDPGAQLEKLSAARQHLYQQADLHIPVGANDTPEQIAARVIAEIPTVLKSSENPPS
jgi:shikimate kinase